MKNTNFEFGAGGPGGAAKEQEANPVEAQEQSAENMEGKESGGEARELTAEDYLSRVNQAQENLRSAQEVSSRVAGQKSKLAGLREKLGISSESDEAQAQDSASAQEQLHGAKENFRAAFGDWGRALAQEKLGQDGEQLSNEKVLAALYAEKMVDTGEADENGEQVSRTLAQEYEARLRSTQEASQEQPPVYKQIASKLFEKYNKIPRKAKVAVGTMCAAGIGAATGGMGAAVMLATDKIVKMKLSGLAAGGVDVFVRKHMQKRDEKKGTTEADFEQQMSAATQESYDAATQDGGGVEKGILEGVEKKMQIFDEMIAHQKSKQKVRMAAAVATGLMVGGGTFSADDAAAASGIGSFSFGGGGSTVDTTGPAVASVAEQVTEAPKNEPVGLGSVKTGEIKFGNAKFGGAENVEAGVTEQRGGVAAQAAERPTARAERTGGATDVDWSDDNWGENIPSMADKMENYRAGATGIDGKSLETDIRPEAFGGKAVESAAVEKSGPRPEITAHEEPIAQQQEQVVAQEAGAFGDVPKDVSFREEVFADGDVEMVSAKDAELGVFDRLTEGEMFTLKNTDAASVMRLANDPQFAGDPAQPVLQRIQTKVGIVRIGEENLESYLGRYSGPISLSEKKAILNFVSRQNSIG